jgi:hypothetical protein
MEREALEPGTKILVLRRDGLFVGVTQERVLLLAEPGADGLVQIRYGAGMRAEFVLDVHEGITWARGWDDPEALVATNTLLRSAE